MFKRCITSAAFTMLALGGVALLIGCGGLNQQPLAPDRAASLQKADESAYSNDSPFTIVFSPKALDRSKAPLRAAKPTVFKTATKWFSRLGGLLNVSFESGDGDGVRLRGAMFVVAPGSITSPVKISMTAFYGSTFEDVGVKFTPSGQTFNPPAVLTLAISGKLDPAQMKVYHISGGAVTETSFQVFPAGQDLWIVVIKVPGFSIYSIGDELIPEAGP